MVNDTVESAGREVAKYKRLFSYLFPWYFIACCCACILVTFLPWWPFFDALVIPKYFLLFGPRWWLLVLVMMIPLGWKYLSKRQLTILPFMLVLSLNYLDFQLPRMWSSLWQNENDSTKLTVLTANVGEGGLNAELKIHIEHAAPDILLLQEASKVNISTLFDIDYFTECLSGLCIASKYPFEQENTLDRKLIGGWGKFAIFYRIKTPYGDVSLANVHFETPRSVLMGAIYGYPDFDYAKEVDGNRQFEASIIGLWANSKLRTLIAGDFNMPADENIYRQNFSGLNNAVDVRGVGVNYTKFTSWHGVRIDHILYSDDFELLAVKVINTLSGDHKPIMATFSMANEYD